jgi:protein-S-isoprenylcysteine O-methyltransferase Ste14
LLVFAQVACLIFIGLTAPLKAIRIELQIWELSGVFIAISGIFGLNWHSFSVFPEPKNKGRLVQSGIFAYIRHPTYAGILIVSSTLIWQFWSIPRLMALCLLSFVLIFKILREEKMLAQKFPDYEGYKKNTNRLIPFLW